MSGSVRTTETHSPSGTVVDAHGDCVWSHGELVHVDGEWHEVERKQDFDENRDFERVCHMNIDVFVYEVCDGVAIEPVFAHVYCECEFNDWEFVCAEHTELERVHVACVECV